MSWFYYSGKIPKPIPVRKGLTISALPHSRVEIFDTNLREIQVLRRKGELRPTGKPSNHVPVKNVTVASGKDVAAVTPKSAMARSTAEKGRTTSPAMPPKVPKGKSQEMTDGEIASVSGKIVSAPAEVEPTITDNNNSVDASQVPEQPDVVSEEQEVVPSVQKDYKDDEVVEVLSDVESSSVDKDKSEQSVKSKKKRRKK